MVVLRMHDHWHDRHPDAIQAGMTRALGWQRFVRSENEHLFTLPETTLGQLAASIRDKLGAPTLRVVGDPKRRVSKVAMAPGFAGFSAHVLALRRDDVQALVIGEAHEWGDVQIPSRRGGHGQVAHRDRAHPIGAGGHGGLRALARAAREGDDGSFRSSH
jgi:hypothetical protein